METGVREYSDRTLEPEAATSRDGPYAAPRELPVCGTS
jgi:hypothetical protein